MRTSFVLLLALGGCYETVAPDCTITCATDDECPGDLSCIGGACSAGRDCEIPPVVDTCTANEFVDCGNASTARICNANGDGTVDLDCGAPGCNEPAERCNVCTPEASSCADASTLQSCLADGSAFTMMETCALGCADASGAVGAHCRTIVPEYLSTICDTPAVDAEESYTVSGTLDTSLANTCTTVITQTAGREICVIRAGRIQINQGVTMTFTGTRAIALVGDDAVNILGTLDVSADGAMDGPGGGSIGSGAKATQTLGGGGSGFKTVGANGGGPNGTGTGGMGGVTQNPVALNSLIGGPRPLSGGLGVTLVGAGGGGGGALSIISCKGTVTVSGMIDAGGGGGGGGRDQVGGQQVEFTSAGGGGAGGQVLLQGAQVNVTSTAQLYANGGGGGGGTTANDQAGGAGQDGRRSASAAAGGVPLGSGGAGGNGGAAGSAPSNGAGSSTSSGGGGGSTGMLRVNVPAGVTATITPQAASPGFETVRTVMTR